MCIRLRYKHTFVRRAGGDAASPAVVTDVAVDDIFFY